MFLKRWVSFVFLWWQLNNPAVREFGGLFIDMIFFFGRCCWLVDMSVTKERGSWAKKEKGKHYGRFKKKTFSLPTMLCSVSNHLKTLKDIYMEESGQQAQSRREEGTWPERSSARQILLICFSLPSHGYLLQQIQPVWSCLDGNVRLIPITCQPLSRTAAVQR